MPWILGAGLGTFGILSAALLLGALLQRGRPLAKPLAIAGAALLGMTILGGNSVAGVLRMATPAPLTPAIAWRAAFLPLLTVFAAALGVGVFISLSPLTASRRSLGYVLAGIGAFACLALLVAFVVLR